MSDKYKIHEQNAPYFNTMTTVGWIDVFTRKELKLLIVDSLKYCQNNKGLIIYAWCLMPSHLHMICSADDGFVLTDILRDFKKYTSKAIINEIQEISESRREWMMDLFAEFCAHLKRDQKFKAPRSRGFIIRAFNKAMALQCHLSMTRKAFPRQQYILRKQYISI